MYLDMTQTTVQTEVLQAMHDGVLSPYGTATVQMQKSTGYVAVPIELVQGLGIGQGYEVQRGYHAPTGCLILCLRNDYDLFSAE